MARIQTLEQFRDYIKLKSGSPILQMEMTNTQIDQCIEDAVDYFCRYAYEEGSFLDYAILRLTSGVDEIPMTSAYDLRTNSYLTNVMDVYDFVVATGMDGINVMFSPTNILLYNEWVVRGNYPGGVGTLPDTGLTMSNYYTSMGYLKEIQNTFSKRYTINFLPGREVFKIVPTPSQDMTGVLQYYRRENAEFLYNHVHVKKLAVAKCQQLWSRFNIGMYDVTLPDGNRINYEAIFNMAREDEEKVMESIRLEAPPVDIMFG